MKNNFSSSSIHSLLAAQKVYLHPFHIVSPSPWPIYAAFLVFPLTIGAVMFMHSYSIGLLVLILGIIGLIITAYGWWSDVIREAVYESAHTKKVQNGLRLGFILFLVSEAMFFFAFFWAFFYFALSPSIHIGCLWPPYAITPINPFKTPLLNTFILLTSAITITYTHRRMRLGYSLATFVGFIETLFLAFFFVAKQFFEYLHAPFAISDGVYGSTFYMITGLHGSHVIAGALFILVNFIRFTRNEFARNHHLGFLFGLWYWHFVDVIWIFVYIFIYVWGSWRIF